jgi:hypothetical protein
MANKDELYDKRRGQRMLLTKWIKVYNSTDDDAEQEKAVRKLADVLSWAASVGISPYELAEDRELPHRALQLLQTSPGSVEPASDAELIDAIEDVELAVDTMDVVRLGKGEASVYAYGYHCAPERLKIGKTAGDIVRRIVGTNQRINSRAADTSSCHFDRQSRCTGTSIAWGTGVAAPKDRGRGPGVVSDDGKRDPRDLCRVAGRRCRAVEVDPAVNHWLRMLCQDHAHGGTPPPRRGPLALALPHHPQSCRGKFRKWLTASLLRCRSNRPCRVSDGSMTSFS